MPRRPSRSRTRTAALAVVGIGLLALTACGSSSASKAAPATSSPTTAAGSGSSSTSTTAPTNTGPGTAAPVASSGCRTGATIGSVARLEAHTLNGTTRTYLVTAPATTAAKPLPLVLDFHGLAEGSQVHSMMSQVSPKALTAGFIAVLPQGLGPVPHWQVDPDPAKNADLVFVTKVLDEVEMSRCVDTSRVYAMGLSNGAFMSTTLACALSDRFAAVAPVSGLTNQAGCHPTRRVPILAFHGTADPILLFNGGVGARLSNTLGKGAGTGTTVPEAPLPTADLNGPGYPANAAAWAARNGCTGKPKDHQLTATVIQRTWTCPATSPVVFDIITGGGHSWPGSAFSQKIAKVVGPTDMSINATDVIWSFFQRFALPAK